MAFKFILDNAEIHKNAGMSRIKLIETFCGRNKILSFY